MKKIAVLATASVLAVGGSTAAYAYAASTPDPAPAVPQRAVLGGETSGISSPSFVRTSNGVRPVGPSASAEDHHRGRHGGDDGRHGGHGRDHAEDDPTASAPRRASATASPHEVRREDRREAEPGDDHGTHTEPGDDHGTHAEPGDDHGGREAEPGDDHGGRAAEPGDDHGGRHGGHGSDD